MKVQAERLIGKIGATTLATGLLLGLSASPALALPEPRWEQWVFNKWGVVKEVWPVSTGKGVTVAVLDLGVEARLPELQGVVLSGKNFNPNALGKKDGRVDEDVVGGGRGTEMAALIAAQGRGTGMAGVAPDARILPVVGRGAGDEGMAQAIRYAADKGAKVINMSYRASDGACTEVVQKAVAYAISRDAVLVASAGSQSPEEVVNGYPANCAGVLAVGAIDGDKKLWNRSQQADFVMAVAPGVLIGTVGSDGKFSYRSGTSVSAGLTSGVIALIRSKYPEMSGRQVVQRLLATCSDIGPPGWDDRAGFGIVIPKNALRKEVPTTAPNPVYERLDRWQTTQAKPQQGGGTGRPAPGSPEDRSASNEHEDTSWRPILLMAVGGGLLLVVGGFAAVRTMRRRAQS